MGKKNLPRTPNGIFQVWNPLYEPQTVYVHAMELSKKGAKSVLWGKIGRPASETNEKVILRMKKSPKSKYLLVTDYLSLHICPIKEIFLANDSAFDISNAPDYYQGKRVSYWYEITDVILISGDQTRTLDELRKLILEQPGGKALDIYSQRDMKLPVPVFVDEKTVQNWKINGVNAKHSLGLPMYILNAMKELQEMVGIDKFSALPDKAKVFLAKGYREYKEQASYEKKAWETSAFLISMAYEAILKEQLAPALCEFYKANKGRAKIKELYALKIRNRNSRMCTLEELLNSPTDGPTLGDFRKILLAISRPSNKHFEYMNFLGGHKSFILNDFLDDRFLKDTLIHLRNQSAHLGKISKEEINNFVDYTLHKQYIFKL